MSIKIYYGARVKEGVSVWEFVRQVRETMNPVRDRLDAQLLVWRAVGETVDAMRDPERTPSERPMIDAWDWWQKDQLGKTEQERGMRFGGHDPHRFEIAVGEDPDTGRLLVLPYIDADEMQDAWNALDCVEPYGYWDNTDPEDGVSDEDWEARRDAWERVGVLDEAPARRMLTYTLRESPCDFDMMLFARRGLISDGDVERRALVLELLDKARESGRVEKVIARMLAEKDVVVSEEDKENWMALSRRVHAVSKEPQYVEAAEAWVKENDPVGWVIEKEGLA